MGFIRANTIPILKEHGRFPFSGALLTLGMPDVYFTFEHLYRMAQTVNIPIDVSVPVTLSHHSAFASKGYISGETLFKCMGFERLSVLDFSDFEGADILFDLNSETTSEHLQEKFDVIIDHGTLEHVFHLPNALKNLFNMLKIGGRVIHSLPTSNLVDHGFYMFSPTLFYDFYSENNWQINNIYVVSMTPRQETEPFFYTEYEPGSFDSVSYGGLGEGMYFTLCFVTKTNESTACKIPQQGVYKKQAKWNSGLR